MTKEQAMDKLLEGYKTLSKERPGEFKGVVFMVGYIRSRGLGEFSPDYTNHNCPKLQTVAQKLEREGFLENYHGHGFRYKGIRNKRAGHSDKEKELLMIEAAAMSALKTEFKSYRLSNLDRLSSLAALAKNIRKIRKDF